MHIEDSPANLVKGNVVAGNGDFGILLEADRNQLRAITSLATAWRPSRSVPAAGT
jgi:parallel beta-helix repeat protein